MFSFTASAENTGPKSDYFRTADYNPLPGCLGGFSVPSEKERYLRKDLAQFMILLEAMKNCQVYKDHFAEGLYVCAKCENPLFER